jgi:hypothetical protein
MATKLLVRIVSHQVNGRLDSLAIRTGQSGRVTQVPDNRIDSDCGRISVTIDRIIFPAAAPSVLFTGTQRDQSNEQYDFGLIQ